MALKVSRRDARRLGEVGLTGWRRPVADAAARPLTKVTPMSTAELRAWLGVGFVLMSGWYLRSTIARVVRTR